jgi:gliding motility-associated-like protein
MTAKVYYSCWSKVILSDHCSPISAVDSVYISVTPPAKAEFSYSPSPMVRINSVVNFMNQSKKASSYRWSFGNGDSSKINTPQVTYTDTGYFTITLIAIGENGCPNDTAYNTIHVENGTVLIYAPDIFTPDGNGLNDLFTIKGTGIASYQYTIYNRWGENIFRSSDTRPDWDGTFRGILVEGGVYLYYLDVLDIYGDHHYLSGNVMVMW